MYPNEEIYLSPSQFSWCNIFQETFIAVCYHSVAKEVSLTNFILWKESNSLIDVETSRVPNTTPQHAPEKMYPFEILLMLRYGLPGPCEWSQYTTGTFSPQSYAFLSPGLDGCTLTKHALFACLLFSVVRFFFVFLKGCWRCRTFSLGKHEKNWKLDYL